MKHRILLSNHYKHTFVWVAFGLTTCNGVLFDALSQGLSMRVRIASKRKTTVLSMGVSMPHQTTNSPFRLRTDRGMASTDSVQASFEIEPATAIDLHVEIDAEDIATIVVSNIAGLAKIVTPALDLISLNCRSKMRRLMGNCRKTGEVQRDVFEIRALSDCHVMLVARLDTSPGPLGRLVLSGCDVSEFACRQREIERQAVLLEQILEVAPHNIFWKDKECRFLGGNANFIETLGVDSIDDLVGKTDFDFSPTTEAESYQTIDANVMKCGEPVVNLVEHRTRDDGTETVLVTNKVPLRNKDGEITGLLGVFEEITERKMMEEKLLHRATHDDLTGLANRRVLIGKIGQSMNDTSPNCATLLFLDVDRFKVVNDSLGHAVGDQLLVAIADRLKSILGEDQFLARLGGDEFAILLTTEANDDALDVGRRVVDGMCKAFCLDDKEIYSSASIGIVHVTDRYGSPDEVLRDADIAMYRAKSAGKSRYQLFDQSMYFEASRELTRQNEVRRAVEAMEFELYYQPIVDLASQECTGFEALVRWTPPGKQPVSPALFMPYLEETGSIIPVGEWIINEACRQLKVWQDRYSNMQSMKMAVNLSSIQFNSANLVSAIKSSIEEHEVDPQQLVTEITETAVAESPRNTIKKLKELRELGVRVAMDDFGVGYSALGKLDQLPIDILKIDRSFVERIGFSDSEPLVQAVLQMSKTLGLATVAEGIEHYHQAQWLQENGCHEAQGYLYARPLPAQTSLHPFEHINLPGYA